MKRIPLALSFLLFIALCVTLTFWGMAMFKPVTREVALPASAELATPGAGSWGGIFGESKAAAAMNSAYSLKGVVLAKHGVESVAIISVDDKPALAVQVGSELRPSVTLKEAFHDYVLISDNGVTRRLDLPMPAAIQNTSPQLIAPTFQNNTANGQLVPQQVAPPAFGGRNNGMRLEQPNANQTPPPNNPNQ